MASHRRPKQPNRARVSVLTATAAAAVALTSQAAHADPKPSVKDVKSKVDDLYKQTEQATEKYDGAKSQESKLQKEVGNLQDKVARGQAELNKMRDALGAMATAQYRTGGIDPSVQLFLSSNPDSYLDKASTLDQVSAKQADQLREIQAKQRELAQERKQAQDKMKSLAAARKELGGKKKEIQGKLADANKLLNTLTAQQRAQMQQDEQQAANRSSSRVSLGKGVPASKRAAVAFAAAQTRLGKPYVYGATGPNSFDCSGLMMWAYAHAGVSLPRTSQAQGTVGPHLGRSQLEIGDLVIMDGGSHVGMYAGNGQVLHAPHTGTVVKYEAMSDMIFDYGVRVG
ncbi:C40 family peptidase [Streptomyces montanisoli]|uniref:C40 family peptidase n=1 Tax=Streptomyces montanisoli TaxID=2798581 RepID=A0A940MII9_9ACTN|nr:NlpC/P60 family protein [Streptomyces montanisoli]MBP0461473.1 C40 family peptidase [Streptomyces montanisoli]